MGRMLKRCYVGSEKKAIKTTAKISQSHKLKASTKVRTQKPKNFNHLTSNYIRLTNPLKDKTNTQKGNQIHR